MGQHTRAQKVHVERMLAYGLWALPAYGALLALSTLTHQPDYTTDFSAYASYVTTDVFLASHIGASIAGAVVGVIGVVCATVLLAEHGPRPGRTLLAGILSVAGNVVSTAIFGVAAFAQPAIGRAYQAGASETAVGLNSDVYGPELAAAAVTGLVLYIAGAVMLGLAMLRADRRLRWPGIVYAVSMPVFAVTGLAGLVVQPVAAAAMAVATVLLAARLGHTDLPAADASTTPQPAT